MLANKSGQILTPETLYKTITMSNKLADLGHTNQIFQSKLKTKAAILNIQSKVGFREHFKDLNAAEFARIANFYILKGGPEVDFMVVLQEKLADPSLTEDILA
jgi:hypothetical protein